MQGRTGFPTLTPQEAADYIQHGAMVAFSGFTPAVVAAKAVPAVLANVRGSCMSPVSRFKCAY